MSTWTCYKCEGVYHRNDVHKCIPRQERMIEEIYYNSETTGKIMVKDAVTEEIDPWRGDTQPTKAFCVPKEIRPW